MMWYKMLNLIVVDDSDIEWTLLEFIFIVVQS